MTSGKPVSVRLEQPASMLESSCVLPMEGIAVEVFEKSSAKERRLTKATLGLLEDELRPLASNPNWETIQKLVPPESIIEGEPSLNLRKSYSPGEYSPEILVNPGEPGRIYLKAFEVTRGTPLSVSELEEYSNEYVGWSDDPRQQFFSTAQIMIDEGDWEDLTRHVSKSGLSRTQVNPNENFWRRFSESKAGSDKGDKPGGKSYRTNLQ